MFEMNEFYVFVGKTAKRLFCIFKQTHTKCENRIYPLSIEGISSLAVQPNTQVTSSLYCTSP
jgi:hypothetical protein